METTKPKMKYHDEEDVDSERPTKSTDHLHISRKVIAKFGTTDGCPGCDAIIRRGHIVGRLGYNHSTACRNRVMEAMSEDPEYKHLVQKQIRNELKKHLEVIIEEQRHEQITHVKKAILAIETQQHHDQRDRKMNAVMMELLLNPMDVAEVYSPPRVATMVRGMGLRQGWSLDLTTCDRDGRSWDFNTNEMRNRAARKVLQDKFVL